MAQGPGMGPGDSRVPWQVTALRWDPWSHVGMVEEPGGSEWLQAGGDHHLVPMVGTIPLYPMAQTRADALG